MGRTNPQRPQRTVSVRCCAGTPVRRIPPTDTAVAPPGTAVPDIVMAGVAATTVVAVWAGALVPASILGVVAAAILGRWSRSWATVILVVALSVVGGVRADHAWNGLAPDRIGPYDGWVRLVDDPHPYGAGTRLVVAIDGERFEVWCRGPRPTAPRQRLACRPVGGGERHPARTLRSIGRAGSPRSTSSVCSISTGWPMSTPAGRWHGRPIVSAG